MARTRDEKLAKKRKADILDAAAHCFVAKGIHQASMRHICRKSGLSAGAVYNYFDSKDAIIEAMAKRDREEIQQISEYLLKTSNKLEATIQAAEWIVGETSKAEAQLQIELLSEASRNPKVKSYLHINDSALFQCFSDAVEAGQKGGTISNALKPDAFTQVIVATYEGFLGRIATDEKCDRKEMQKLTSHILTKLLWPQG